MEISKEHRQEMEQIIDAMKSNGPNCRKDYECYKSSLEKLCNIKYIENSFIECFDSKEVCACGLSLAFGDSHFCKCPLRRYIAKNFHRGLTTS